MKAIKINNDRDPIIESGKFLWVYGIDVIKQNCNQAMRQQIGELSYDKDKGIQYFENALTGNPNLQRFEAQARREISEVDGVTGIISFGYSLVDSVLNYEAEISTKLANTIIRGQL